MEKARIELIKQAIRVFLFVRADWVTAIEAEIQLKTVTKDHFRQVVARLIKEEEAERMTLHNKVYYRWIGMNLGVSKYLEVPEENQAPPAEAQNITPPRRYVNGSMETGDAAYWKKQTTWGRT